MRKVNTTGLAGGIDSFCNLINNTFKKINGCGNGIDISERNFLSLVYEYMKIDCGFQKEDN